MSIENLDLIVHNHKHGRGGGLTSICSSHLWVLQAAMQEAALTDQVLLIESTCNQVNQFGGYTGMMPADFVQYIHQMVYQVGLAEDQLILGGDHLGPSVWQDEPVETAMEKATHLVMAYIHAGYRKIHLDASMKLGGDPSGPIKVEVAAERTAMLAAAAEQAYAQLSSTNQSGPDLYPMPDSAPRYVIGTEVPIPGGAQVHETSMRITSPEMAQQTIDYTRIAFERAGLAGAWERVIALVVQPGVEFGDNAIIDYKPEAAQQLSRFIEGEENLIYEAHSTDYQRPDALRRMVKDHFAILKVGPALTFSFREAVFGLAAIESELIPDYKCSRIVQVLEDTMVSKPEYWQKHYHGTAEQQRLARKYSFSDRSRYYWSQPVMQSALEQLLDNLHHSEIPLALFSQYFPQEYLRIRSGKIPKDPNHIILSHIGTVLANYEEACGWDFLR